MDSRRSGQGGQGVLNVRVALPKKEHDRGSAVAVVIVHNGQPCGSVSTSVLHAEHGV
jgi:hypothetical protein